MGEAIISRYSGEPEAVIPITPGYHSILLTLKDYDGDLLKNYPVNCKDGSIWYNYSTNEKGQCLFTCNSGSANFYIPNVNQNHKVISLSSMNKNVDAPIGGTTKLNINLQNGSNFYEFTSSTLFELHKELQCNLILVGGGGGGNAIASWLSQSAGGGGAGYMNQYNDQVLFGKYNFSCGAGGIGGYVGSDGHGGWLFTNPESGGTSVILNTDYYAIGGSAANGLRGGIGGLGDGGNGIWNSNNGKRSPVNFAGGGGGGIPWTDGSFDYSGKGGKPYGGNAGYGNSNGSRGGGGGVIAGGTGVYAGRGGAGLMRIEIIY